MFSLAEAVGLEPTEDRSRQIYSLVHLPLCYAPSKKSNLVLAYEVLILKGPCYSHEPQGVREFHHRIKVIR